MINKMILAGSFGPVVFIFLFLTLVESKYYGPPQFHHFQAPSSHYEGNPTSRHKNHCAYVVEKMVTFTVQEGSAPYVKAEYNKCSWGQKCPALQYRLMYKPIFKVAHKTVTELEWRCCPGYSGYGCMEGPAFHHMMPPFKGPPMKGPPMKGPPMKGPPMKGPPMKGPPMKGPPMKGPPMKGPPMKGPPMKGQPMKGPPMKGPPMKGPPMKGQPMKGPQYNPPVFKGQPMNTAVQVSPWAKPEPPTDGFNPFPMHHFGPGSSPYPDTSFEPPSVETEQLTDHGPLHHEHEQIPDHSQGPKEHIAEENPHEGEPAEGQFLDSEVEERLLQMEEDVQRLSHGLETLKGTVDGLEGSLRASLREDANRMLSTLLSAAPAPVPAPATASGMSSVGFGEIPGGDAQAEGIDGGHGFPGLAELREKVDALKSELQVKTAELKDLKATVTEHDNTLKKISHKATPSDSPDLLEGEDKKALENMMQAKLSAARTEILGGFEKRVEIAESRCEEKAGDVHRQCKKEQGEKQEHMEDALVESTTDLKTEMTKLQLQINDLKATNSCCSRIGGISERVGLLETSMTGLNQSQTHLRVEMSGHKDHIEGVLEGRLAYLEEKLNVTGHRQSNESESRNEVFEMAEIRLALEDRLEGKLKALEGRLLNAVEELSNATAPTLLEGHAVPTLETELESLRGRLELDVDRVQKQLNNLETMCSSSCSTSKTPSPIQGDSASSHSDDEQNISGTLDIQADRLNRLNVTLQNIMKRLTDQQEQESPLHGELTILRFYVFSVNHTLKGLQESMGTVVQQVDKANSSWHERESRLAQQMKGVVQLVSRQASMLGSGERRLSRLKGELLEMKRRLADEVRGCRSTALGVQKEVTEVGGRVASVENQCKGLNFLADDLERIREELEKQSTGLLQQVNGTLSSHTQQLSELKDELKNCTTKLEPTQQGLELDEPPKRGDTFTLG